jgi:hypothetical protein
MSINKWRKKRHLDQPDPKSKRSTVKKKKKTVKDETKIKKRKIVRQKYHEKKRKHRERKTREIIIFSMHIKSTTTTD